MPPLFLFVHAFIGRHQKRASDPLEPELRLVVSHPVRALDAPQKQYPLSSLLLSLQPFALLFVCCDSLRCPETS